MRQAELDGFIMMPCARICKRLWSPGIDSKESIPPACVAWRAGTSNRVVVTAHRAKNRFLGSLKGLQIRALRWRWKCEGNIRNQPSVC
jgi:hypothetical protein